MKRLFLTCFLCLGLQSLPSFAQEDDPAAPAEAAPVISDQKGIMQATLPADWKLNDMPQMGIKVGLGEVTAGMPVNANMLIQPFDGDLKAYIEENIKQLKAMFPDVKILSQNAFKTDGGIDMIRLVTENDVQGMQVFQVFYVGKAKGGDYFLLTCSSSREAGEKYKPLFDKIGKSIQPKQ